MLKLMKVKPHMTRKPDPLVKAAEKLPRGKRARKRNEHLRYRWDFQGMFKEKSHRP